MVNPLCHQHLWLSAPKTGLSCLVLPLSIDICMKRETKVNSNFSLLKSSKKYCYFYLHFTWIYGPWSNQTILKNDQKIKRHIERLKPTSNWYKISIHFCCTESLILNSKGPSKMWLVGRLTGKVILRGATHFKNENNISNVNIYGSRLT